MGASFGDLFRKSLTEGYTSATPVAVPQGFNPTSADDQAYTAAMRPGYSQFGPSGQFQQPIYQSSYQNYVQPTSLYAPTYSPGAAYNPFVQQATAPVTSTPNNENDKKVGKAGGGAIQYQGIDALLK